MNFTNLKGEGRGNDTKSHRPNHQRSLSVSLMSPVTDNIDPSYGFAELHARSESDRRSLNACSRTISAGDASLAGGNKTHPNMDSKQKQQNHTMDDMDVISNNNSLDKYNHVMYYASLERAPRSRISRGEQVTRTRGVRSQSLPRYLYSNKWHADRVTEGDVLRNEYIKMRQRLQQLHVNGQTQTAKDAPPITTIHHKTPATEDPDTDTDMKETDVIVWIQ